MKPYSVTTTHDFALKGDRCANCSLMLKNVASKPKCKVAQSVEFELKVDGKGRIYERSMTPMADLKPVPNHGGKWTHSFKGGTWCDYCDVRDYEEHKKPWCERKYKKPMGQPDKDGASSVGPSCHVSHPVLTFGKLEIYGGSCGFPKVTDCDVYIGFDGTMKFTKKSAPWRRGEKGAVEEVMHRVTDFKAPSDPKEFKRLVEWTLEQMKAGKKVHAGCIGGHGRTGTFFAAIAAMQNEIVIEDCILYVREHYCKKAVENDEQIKFLVKHFGVKTKATGSKSFTTDKVKGWKSKYSSKEIGDFDAIDDLLADDDMPAKDPVYVATPKPSAGNVWGRSLGEEDL